MPAELWRAWKSSIVLVDLSNVRDDSGRKVRVRRGGGEYRPSAMFSLSFLDEFVASLLGIARRAPVVLVVGWDMRNPELWEPADFEVFWRRVANGWSDGSGPINVACYEAPKSPNPDKIILRSVEYVDHHLRERPVVVVSNDQFRNENEGGLKLLRESGRHCHVGFGSVGRGRTLSLHHWQKRWNRRFRDVEKDDVVQPFGDEEMVATLKWLTGALLPGLASDVVWSELAPPPWSKAEEAAAKAEQERRRIAEEQQQAQAELVRRQEELWRDFNSVRQCLSDGKKRISELLDRRDRDLGALDAEFEKLCTTTKPKDAEKILKDGRRRQKEALAYLSDGLKAILSDEFNTVDEGLKLDRAMLLSQRVQALLDMEASTQGNPRVSDASNELYALRQAVQDLKSELGFASDFFAQRIAVFEQKYREIVEAFEFEGAPLVDIREAVVNRAWDGRLVKIAGRVERHDSRLYVVHAGCRIALQNPAEAVPLEGKLTLVIGKLGTATHGTTLTTTFPGRSERLIRRVSLREVLELAVHRDQRPLEEPSERSWIPPVRSRSLARIRRDREEIAASAKESRSWTKAPITDLQKAEEALGVARELTNRAEKSAEIMTTRKAHLLNEIRSDLESLEAAFKSLKKEHERRLKDLVVPLESISTATATEPVASQPPPPTRVAMPDVVGLSSADATARLRAASLKEERVRVYDGDVENGTVVAQEPAPGATVGEEAFVRIAVSKGARLVRIPSLVGENRSEAELKLSGVGLESKVSSVTAGRGMDGRVVRIEVLGRPEVTEGDRVPVGSRVILHVAHAVGGVWSSRLFLVGAVVGTIAVLAAVFAWLL